jgi:hypothetical protein
VSLDPALLEAAIRKNDADGVRSLLTGATESDRAACSRALKDLLKGPGFPLEPIFMLHSPAQLMELMASGVLDKLSAEHRQQSAAHRAYDEWRAIAQGRAYQAAVFGLAGGVKVALQAAQDFGGYLVHGKADTEMIVAVLADCRPRWLADFVDRHPQRPIGIAAWPLARKLVRLGVIPKPDVPEYTTLMPHALAWPDPDLLAPRALRRGVRRDPVTTIVEALLADPGLLEDEVWRLFTVPDAGKALADMGQMWVEALARLAEQGDLERGRLIDACLSAFSRDFHPNRVSWYAALLERLGPSVAEIADRSSAYLGLFSATSKTGVQLGQAAARALLTAGKLDPDMLLDVSDPALLHPQKSIAMAQLKLLETVLAQVPGSAARAAATIAVAFGHQRQDVQEAALKVLARRGMPDGAPLGELRLRAMDLSSSLLPQAAALGLVGDDGDGETVLPEEAAELAVELFSLEFRIGALSAARVAGLDAAFAEARQGNVPGPGQVEPGEGTRLAEPVTDADELVQLLTVLMEDASDALAAERALGGAVRLSALPERQRRHLVAPLLKRAKSRAEWVPFVGNDVTADFALVALALAGDVLPDHGDHRTDSAWCPGEYPVTGSGQARTMGGIFSARAWEAARLIQRGQGGTLLAEPQTERGTISAEGMLDRVQQLAGADGGRHLLAGSHDRDVALLRLGADVPNELWTAWSNLERIAPVALAESHRVVRSPLSFEAVTAPLPRQPYNSSLDGEVALLARVTGTVAVASACACWQLLTRLSNPIADHAFLTNAGRLENRYHTVVAGWALLCPWQPELAAAHLLRPVSDGIYTASTSAQAITAMTVLNHPAQPLGVAGHLALIAGLSSASADVRIAAADLWAAACNDGRLDPRLAASALATGVNGGVLKLNRVTDGLQNAASSGALPARRIVEMVCHGIGDLVAAAPANLHTLIELAARLGASAGVPPLPDAVRDIASRRGASRLVVTARQLVQAAQGPAPQQRQAAVHALTALVAQAEAG